MAQHAAAPRETQFNSSVIEMHQLRPPKEALGWCERGETQFIEPLHQLRKCLLPASEIVCRSCVVRMMGSWLYPPFAPISLPSSIPFDPDRGRRFPGKHD